MKFSVLIMILLLPLSALADSSAQTAKQFSNRNWHYHAAVEAREAQLVDYLDFELISKSRGHINNFLNSIRSLSNEQLEKFYPELDASSESDRVVLDERYTKAINGYDVLLGWPALLEALNEEKWDDTGTCNLTGDVMANPNCGRRSKADYVVTRLTSSQRSRLDELKQVVMDDLDLIRLSNGRVIVGSGPVRFFQAFHDSRVVDKLIQPAYVKVSDPLDANLRKKNLIELGRALIIQFFQGKNGRIVNSNLMDIDLESDDCLELPSNEVDSCQLNYIRTLIWDPAYEADDFVVNNLIIDSIGITPLMDSLIKKFSAENPEYVSRVQMEEFIERAYLTLCIAYDVDPLEPPISSQFKAQFIQHVMLSSDYLIQKRSIIALHMARGLQELVIFLEDSNEK